MTNQTEETTGQWYTLQREFSMHDQISSHTSLPCQKCASVLSHIQTPSPQNSLISAGHPPKHLTLMAGKIKNIPKKILFC